MKKAAERVVRRWSGLAEIALQAARRVKLVGRKMFKKSLESC